MENGSYFEDDIDYSDPVASFERGRIKALKDERENIQKKTFTKWCNSFLSKARMEVIDLFVDLCDGIMLMKLLEIISGEKLGKANRGRMRVHKIENLNKMFSFLKKKNIHLENIGAEDILDGNERLILGLIWTIILRFQIEGIMEPNDPEDEGGEKKSAKDALLLWCQRKTRNYPNVKIENFTTSWRSGLGFNALIHAHRPDLMNYDALKPNDHIGNLNNAFDVAERDLGITRLLDAEDVDVARPDEKSVLTYVSTYYHYFARQTTETIGARRIAKVVGQLVNVDRCKEEYERISSDLLDWIQQKCTILNGRNFPNSLKGIQQEMISFKQYRTVEKPPRYKQKGELEAVFFDVQTKLKALRSKVYLPPPNLAPHDLEVAWNELEKAENSRQIALYQELLRQERLQQLAARFEAKGRLRETWLKEMTAVLQDHQFGNTATEVEANLKKHEAIKADILPREDRFKNLSAMADQLDREAYFDKDKIRVRERELLDKWKYLLQALDRRHEALLAMNELTILLRDTDTMKLEMNEILPVLKSRDVGKHVMAADDLLQRHSLSEAQVTAQGEWMSNIKNRGDKYIRSRGPQHELLQQKVNELQKSYDSIVQMSDGRRQQLERAKQFFQFIQDLEEEESWIVEKINICNNVLHNGDLNSVVQLQRMFKMLETDMQSHWQKIKKITTVGESLMPKLPPQSREDVQQGLFALQERWEQLKVAHDKLQRWLQEASAVQQYLQDVNEAESWMREKMPLVCSDDFGKDEQSSYSLYSRHTRLQEEIEAYKSDVERLEETVQELSSAEILASSLKNANVKSSNVNGEVVTRTVPQVKATYAYSGHGMDMQKGEVLALVQKTNDDWWRVVRNDGQEGFVPASYVKEVDSRVIEVTPSSPSTSEPARNGDGVENPLQARQNHVSSTYRRLKMLAQTRRRYLEDAMKLYGFHRDCNEFETWAAEIKKMLNEDYKQEDVESSRKKFDKLVTDMVANGCTRLNAINKQADELVANDHSQSDHIRARQLEVNDIWKNLLRGREEKRQLLETLETLAAFEQNCDETRAWLDEKIDLFNQEPSANDPKALEALQRRHQQLERELRPIEDKMNNVNDLAKQVATNHPNEKGRVNSKVDDLNSKWGQLKQRVKARHAELEESQGVQMFQRSAKLLNDWIEKVKKELNEQEKAVDVTTAEEMLKRNEELHEEIQERAAEFDYVNDLGDRVLKKGVGAEQVKPMLNELANERDAIMVGWNGKQKFLQDQLELQLFNRESDHLDSATKAHDAFLDMQDLGDSVEAVEALIRMLGNYENKIFAQDDRLQVYSNMADQLIDNNHSESDYIDERRNKILENRQAVKEKLKQRRAKLELSLTHQAFLRNGDELRQWIGDKMKIATDDSYQDGTNLQRKLKKHEAFEAELKANRGRLGELDNSLGGIKQKQHYALPNMEDKFTSVRSEWDNLESQAADRGSKLRQAVEKKSLLHALDDAHLKLDDFERQLASDDYGVDLRNVRGLLQKQQVLEQDMSNYSKRLDDIYKLGEQMAQEGHYDAPAILKAVAALKTRFNGLAEPCKERRAKLEESCRYYQFIFDVNCEEQWIQEKLPSVSSHDYGTSLTYATNLHMKHEKLEAEINGHESTIESVMVKGKDLIKQKNPKKHLIEEASKDLKKDWQNLKDLSADRKRKLSHSLRIQQYLAEASNVEQWISEKNALFSSPDYGQDELSASKMLNKHKAQQAEMDTYRELIGEMRKESVSLAPSEEGESVGDKQQSIEDQFAQLEELFASRNRLLEDAVLLYQYLRESAELEEWINEQLQKAMSEDYGQDYEHLIEIMSAFDDFKQQVKSGSERFIHCENAARSLLEREPPFINQIQKRQEQLRAVWSLLLDYIESREHKLESAEEIHRFNRDVTEALTRIQEKYSTMSDDFGRDVNSVLALIRKHEAFENELVVLEAQLQVLIEDSSRLQKEYPGGNAEHIADQQKILVDNWNALQEKASQRREDLQAASDLQRYLAQARDLLNWTNQIIALLKSEQPLRDLNSVELLNAENEQILAEIEARNDDFNQLDSMASQLLNEHHYASNEITTKRKQVHDSRDQMMALWKRKKEHYNEQLQLHSFLKDVKLFASSISSQEAKLKNQELGASVDEVRALLSKHETFEKLIMAQEERMQMLLAEGDRLEAQNHPNTDQIREHSNDVRRRWVELQAQMKKRKQALQDALLFQQLNSDLAEAKVWIDDKATVLSSTEALSEDQTDAAFERKMKQLQKHQAFEAELAANEPRIQAIKQNATQLMAVKHPKKDDISVNLTSLIGDWQKLAKASQDRSLGLEEARDNVKFNQLIEKVLSAIRNKELLVGANDVGNDYEHCTSLQKKLDSDNSSVDHETIATVVSLGNKLMKQSPSGKENIKKQMDEVVERWQDVETQVRVYRKRLDDALKVHEFNRDVNETIERVGEKISLLSSADKNVKDLSSVETMIRKQDAIERDMSALQTKISQHQREASKLSAMQTGLESAIHKSMQKLETDWSHLASLAKDRRQWLDKAFVVQKFLNDVMESERWVEACLHQMRSHGAPASVDEAQALLNTHKDKKAEIDRRIESMVQLKEFGEELLENQGSDKKEKIGEGLSKLSGFERELTDTWQKELNKLQQYHDYQNFTEKANQVEDWLSSKEAILSNEDLGDSLDAVDKLSKKMDHFDQTIRAQKSKIEEVEDLGKTLRSQDPSRSHVYAMRSEQLAKRYSGLLALAKHRREKLVDSKEWHQFLKKCGQVMDWLNSRLQIAYDESFNDPTNLKSKVQKHETFDAEARASQDRIDGLVDEAQRMIDRDHFAKEQIKMQRQEIEKGWRELLMASQLKRDRLGDAYAGHVFNRELDDLDRWLDGVERNLSSDDYGYDLPSVTHLIHKHKTLKQEIDAKEKQIEELLSRSEKFESERHFRASELKSLTDSVVERYNAVQEPWQVRHQNLDDAEQLYRWLRDASDELAWIHERIPLAQSSNLGDTLQATQSLHKRHQALEKEIEAHDSIFSEVTSRGRKMVRDEHFAGKQIQEKMSELLREMEKLKAESMQRQQRLLDALEAQTFYADAHDAEDWVRQQMPHAKQTDIANDDETVQTQIKSLESMERNVVQFEGEIRRLQKKSGELVDRRHFQADIIQEVQTRLEQNYNELRAQMGKRRHLLKDVAKYCNYMHQTEELMGWLREKQQTANSEDYGKDLEHCQELSQRFDAFMRELTGAGERISASKKAHDDMIRNNHVYTASIRARLSELQELWADVNEAATERQQALHGAALVHKFDEDVEEAKNWLQDKEAALVSASQDFASQDLPSIQAMLHRHAAFTKEISAAEKLVTSLSTEGERLVNLYPDTREHIDDRCSEMREILKDVKQAADQRQSKLEQAEQLQTYFDDYRDLNAWINEMIGRIISENLGKNVRAAQAIVRRHDEIGSEIDARKDQVHRFVNTGRAMLQKRHILSDAIRDKVDSLESNFNNLESIYQDRKRLYALHLDAELWKKDAYHLDSWLDTHEDLLGDDWKKANSIDNSEEMIRQYDDFLSTLDVQGDKFEQLKRLTLIEQAFSSQKAKEQEQLKVNEQNVEKQRKEQIKTVEKQKILQERRQERERRRTQEIQLFKPEGAHGPQFSPASSSTSTVSSQQPSAQSTARVHRRNSNSGQSGGDMPVEVTMHHQEISTELGAAPGSSRQYEYDQPSTMTTDRNKRSIKPQASPISGTTSRPSVPPPKPSESVMKQPTPYHQPPLISHSTSHTSLRSGGSGSSSENLASPTGKEFSLPPSQDPVNLQRHASFGDQLLGSSEHQQQTSTMSYATPKRERRTADKFTTRRAQSLKKMRPIEDIQSIDKVGILDRKQELQGGGRKAPIRSWKNFYTILCGQLICFFKDEEAFFESVAASPPVYILNAVCSVALDYTKRKHVFKLVTNDGAEFLFACRDEQEMTDWIAKIGFHAALPPALQLKTYKDRNDINTDMYSTPPPVPSKPPNLAGRPPLPTAQSEPRLPSNIRHRPPLPDSKPRPAPRQAVNSIDPDEPVNINGHQRVNGHGSNDAYPMDRPLNGHHDEHVNRREQQPSPEKSNSRPSSGEPPRTTDGEFVAWMQANQEEAPRSDSPDGSIKSNKKRGSRLGSFFKTKKHNT